MLKFYPDYRVSDENRTKIGDWLLGFMLGFLLSGIKQHRRLTLVRWGVQNGGSYATPLLVVNLHWSKEGLMK